MSKRKTTEQFIKEAQKIHGNKFDYSKVNYTNAFSRICIICPKHGEFWQQPHDHLRGYGCNKCRADMVGKRRLLSTEIFIEKAKQIHGDKYDYSKVVYSKSHDKVCIICPKHGEFLIQANHHLNGCGCNKCKMSHLENEVLELLTKNCINFEYDVRNLKFLNGLTLDFYLPEYKIGIECQGIQHFKDCRMFKSEKVIERDNIKRKLCLENGVKLLYYSNLKIDYPYEVITDINNLLKIIELYAKPKVD